MAGGLADGDTGGSRSPDLELHVPFDVPLTGYRKEGMNNLLLEYCDLVDD